MAYVLTLSQPIEGLDRILNVSQRVGPQSDCPNNPDDVELVQRLINLGARNFAARCHFGLPQPTGRFDPLTGFYIFYYQWFSHSTDRVTQIDGAVSPARGVFYGLGVYAIINLNMTARNVDRTGWESLLRRYLSSPLS